MERLSAGLSEGEIQRLLTEALTSMDQTSLRRLAAKLGSDTGAALLRALKARGGATEAMPGAAKVRQEWERAWGEWDGLVFEACDEDGRYINQDQEWEQPYFDPGSLAHDLEPVAAKMNTLLSRVFEEDLDPKFSFAQKVRESLEEIKSSLPDWMDPWASEGFTLGPTATRCLLNWEWLTMRRQGRTAFQWVEDLCRLEVSTEGLCLDEKTVAGFIRGLDAQAKTTIREGIQPRRDQDPWRKALESVHSSWFKIYQELCRGQDRPAYLDTCRSRVHQDWTQALPVVKDLQRHHRHKDILKVCHEALRAFLRLREGESYDLRAKLLIPHSGVDLRDGPNAQLPKLLEGWGQAARAMQEEELSATVRLQADLLLGWRNWDQALAAFRRVPQPRCSEIRDRFFSQWKTLVAEKSLERVLYEPLTRTPGTHWVHFLADAAWRGSDSQDYFCASLRSWLVETERDMETLRHFQDALALLSRDLDCNQQLSKTSPALAHLFSEGWRNDPSLRASRRRWLERLGAVSLVPELLAFWKRNLRRLVPDPALAGPDYVRCADWVKALWEIDAAAGRDLLRQWSTAHHRRRNLWSALRARNLFDHQPKRSSGPLA